MTIEYGLSGPLVGYCFQEILAEVLMCLVFMLAFNVSKNIVIILLSISFGDGNVSSCIFLGHGI